jgi:hypothetical protein
MNEVEQIEIELCKTKMALMIFGSVIFIGLGIRILFASSTFQNSFFYSPTFIKISGLLSILFFGTCFIILTKK